MISDIVCKSYYTTFVTQLCNIDQIVYAKKIQLIPEFCCEETMLKRDFIAVEEYSQPKFTDSILTFRVIKTNQLTMCKGIIAEFSKIHV